MCLNHYNFIKILLIATTSLFIMADLQPVHANPEGGMVKSGQAEITYQDKKANINQSTHKAAIDWRSFDIDPDEHTQFHQPSSSAVTLNRVLSHDPSRILGKLSANGNIILINPNGVFFGADSKVDVNGLIATTSDIKNQDFMDGRMRFDIPGNPEAAIVNDGEITAKEAGLIGLVAPNVLNRGIIRAKLGKVQLVSGDTFTLDIQGFGIMNIEISDEARQQIVSHSGALFAEGGEILITAAAAQDIVNSLITIEGELHSPSVKKENGKITIAAIGANGSDKKGNSHVLISNAVLNASGVNEGEQGGSVEVTADHVGIINNTIIDTSGYSAPIPTVKPDLKNGSATLTEHKTVRSEEDFLSHENRAGGSIKVGGDYLGSGDTQRAKTLYVDDTTVVLNSAVNTGDGGRTIFWSDDVTDFEGLVISQGGQQGGNGGFLETSGKHTLNASGFADLSNRVDGYHKGTYLLDPENISVYGSVDPRFVASGLEIDLDTALQFWLDGSDPSTLYSDLAGTINANDGDTIAFWEDKSGKGNHFRQADATYRPLYDSDGLNNQGVLVLLGDFLATTKDNSIFQNVSGASLFSTALNTESSSPSRIISFTHTNDRRERTVLQFGNETITAGGRRLDANGSQKISGGTIADNTFYSVGGVLDYANSDLFVYQGSQVVNTKTDFQTNGNTSNTASRDGLIGAFDEDNPGEFLNGQIADAIAYNRALTTNEANLIQQYQAAKWGTSLLSDDLATENALATAHDAGNPLNSATNGFSVFSIDYLERLSIAADVHLQASNNINLDFQNDTLNFTTANRALSLTAGNQITTTSGGTINTNNGNVTFNASGGVVLSHIYNINTNGGAFTVNASLSGAGSFNANTGGSSPSPSNSSVRSSNTSNVRLPNTVEIISQHPVKNETQNNIDNTFKAADNSVQRFHNNPSAFLKIDKGLVEQLNLNSDSFVLSPIVALEEE